MIWSFLGGLAGKLFEVLAGWLTRSKQRADHIELGQQRQENVQHRAAEEATDRMHKAQAGPRGPEETGRAMRDGSF